MRNDYAQLYPKRMAMASQPRVPQKHSVPRWPTRHVALGDSTCRVGRYGTGHQDTPL